ncbi:MAG: hypothetical protein ACYTFM_11355, partial [Planctomycetota bacterium]
MAFPLPEKPSIAVLPFDNLSGDPEQEFFIDGLAENIITQLSLIHQLFVISRESTFTYKGKDVEVRQVAEELGVRYILEGSVQGSKDRVRVTAQLIDAINGRHLWADRYDREINEIFTIQDEITYKVVTEIAGELSEGELSRLLIQKSPNFKAYGYYRKSQAQFRKYTAESILIARKLAEKAIEIDPQYSLAYSMIAWTHAFEIRLGASKNPTQTYKQIDHFVNKALESDPENKDVPNLLTYVHILKRQYDQAIIQGRKAVQLAPSVSDAHALLALSLLYAGQAEEAIEEITKAMRLARYYPAYFLYCIGQSYFLTDRYEEASIAFKEGIERNPEWIDGYLWLAVIYSAMGHDKQAQIEVKEALKRKPTLSLEKWRGTLQYKDEVVIDQIIAYARKAGLPEHPPLKLPDRPSIAVLAFDNLSGDETQEYISDGITESIITALSKVPSLFVIARNSSFTYKGKPVKVQQVSQELGIRYVLEGSVQKSGDRIRINAQLIDAIKGHHLWAEKYDRKFEDIFALQDDITLNILKELQVELIGLDRASTIGTNNPEAYLKYLKGLYHLFRWNKIDNEIAREYFEEAIALDPNYAAAYQAVGETYYAEVWGLYSEDYKESISKVANWAQKTLTLDALNPGGHSLMATVYKMSGQMDKAIAEGEKAIELDPNGAGTLFNHAEVLRIANQPEEALKLMEKVMRLNPKPQPWYYWQLGAVYHILRRYDDAIAAYEPVFNYNIDYMSFIAHVGMIFAYLELEKEDKAREHAAAALKLRDVSLAMWAVALLQYKDHEYLKRLMKPLESNQHAGAGKREVYVYEGTPAFKFEYPAGSFIEKELPNPILSSTVLHIKTLNGAYFAASVLDDAGDLSLANFGPKYYVQQLIDSGRGSNVKIISNAPFVLKDGTK